MPKADVVKKINQRWSDRAGGAVLSVSSTETIALTAGVDISISGYAIARKGQNILLFSSLGNLLSEYAPNGFGLTAAASAASSGDLILLPPETIIYDVTIPAGVALRGRSKYNSIIDGQVTLGDGSSLENLTILRQTDQVAALVGMSMPVTGSAWINDVRVEIENNDGPAYAVTVSGGGTLVAYEADLIASTGDPGYAAYVTSGTFEHLFGRAVGSVSKQPYETDPQPTLIVATEIYTTDGGEIYRSTDGGASWAKVETTSAGSGFMDVATDGAGVWCAVHGDSIYRSADDGLTWAVVFDGGSYLYKIATDCDDVWCATDGDSVVWRSTDNGATWAEAFNDQEGDYAEFGPIATDRAGNWLMCEYNSSSTTWVWKSENNGENWAHAGEIVLDPARALYCLGTDRNGVWIVGTRSGTPDTAPMMRSTNLGASWTNVQELSVADIESVVADCNGIWCAGTYNGGKVFRSDDAGLTWAEAYDPAAPTTSGDAMCTDENGTWYMAAWQGGEVHKSTDDGANWSMIYAFAPDSLWPQGIAIGADSTAAVNVYDVAFEE